MRIAIAVALCALVAGPAAFADAIKVNRAVPYLDPAIASEEIRRDCDWNARIVDELVRASRGAVQVTDEDLTHAPGQVLLLGISSLHTAAGALFSGPKWAHMQGRLMSDGREIAHFDLNGGGLVPWHATACGALRAVGKVLGHRTAAWLRRPTNVTERDEAPASDQH